MYFFFNDKKYIDFIFELIELQDESCVFFEEVKKKSLRLCMKLLPIYKIISF